MCVFCEIASGRISAEVLYEDELVMAFKDANPVSVTANGEKWETVLK